MENDPKITHTIDMDGFKINKKFYCKEMACIRVECGEIYSSHYNIERHRLSRGDFTLARFCTMFVHGLKMDDDHSHQHREAIEDFLRGIDKEPSSLGGIIGYKGGSIEREKLTFLEIPSYNILKLGCPKFEILYNQLREQRPDLFEIMETLDYLQHDELEVRRGESTPRIAHCAQKEVYAFNQFLLGNV